MKQVLMSTTMILAAALPAMAATDAQSLTDLNLRSGPGVMNEVTGVIAEGDTVAVLGCIAEVNWCKVDYNGQSGWAYGEYLTANAGTERITLVPDARRTEVIEVIEPDDAGAPIAGASAGALTAAALAAGPIGIAAAGIAGAALADAADEPEVERYVLSNPVDPVILDGEVVVGAGVPDTVTLYPVPDTTYSYLWVNGVPAIVANDDRRIVRILR